MVLGLEEEARVDFRNQESLLRATEDMEELVEQVRVRRGRQREPAPEFESFEQTHQQAEGFPTTRGLWSPLRVAESFLKPDNL